MSLESEVNRSDHSALLIWAVIAVVCLTLYFMVSSNLSRLDRVNVNNSADMRSLVLEVERRLDEVSTSEISGVQNNIAADAAGYGNQRFRLLQQASQEVSSGNHELTIARLLELGALSIDSLNLTDAELYLEEALLLSKAIGSARLTGSSYQLLGHLHIKKRNLARRAAHAYDSLLVVRNRIALGQYQGNLETLQTIIGDNLLMGRLGAAAGAWTTLASLHEKQFDLYQANLANIEAARLFAKTGSIIRARELVNGLSINEIDAYSVSALAEEIEHLARQYEQNKHQLNAAQDLRSLYYHYKERGDDSKAWEYRLKASELMAKTGDQLMFQRHPDVLAVLYKSNNSMEKARDYLQLAVSAFNSEGMGDQVRRTEELKKLVF